MYLKKDILLNDFFPAIHTSEELFSLMSDCFKEDVEYIPTTSLSTSLMALLAYVANYVTLSELCQILGDYFSASAVENICSKLSQKGLYKKFRLSSVDFGYATCAYHATDLCFESYLSSVGSSLKGDGVVSQRKRTTANRKGDAVVPMHDYGLGISLLSLITLRTRMEIKKEVDLLNRMNVSTKRAKSGVIRVDCIVDLKNEYGQRRIYLEQDMGTEGTGTLLHKIEAYGFNRYLQPSSNTLVFSCHSSFGGIRGKVLTIAELKKLKELLTNYAYDKVYEFYREQVGILEESEKRMLERFLVNVSVCSGERGADGLLFTLSTADFSLYDLDRYISEILSGTNPYVARIMNAREMAVSKHTLSNMFMRYAQWIDHGFFDNQGMVSLLGGYSILVVPSTLLSNSAAWLLPHHGDSFRKYRTAVSRYFPFIDKWEYKEVSDAVELRVPDENGEPGLMNVSFRNVFSDGEQMVCFEHIGRDLGALVRLKLLSVTEGGGFPAIQFIAICDCYEDVLRFSSVLITSGKSSCEQFTSNVYFLLENGIANDGTAYLLQIKDGEIRETLPPYPSDDCGDVLDIAKRFRLNRV